jgi:alcohol dehydrogenase
VVLMGGVGRRSGTDHAVWGQVDPADLALPYPWLMRNDITVRGKYMYPRAAVGRMVGPIRAGLIDLTKFDLTEFALDDANEAVAHSAANAGPRQLTVLRPNRGAAVAAMRTS